MKYKDILEAYSQMKSEPNVIVTNLGALRLQRPSMETYLGSEFTGYQAELLDGPLPDNTVIMIGDWGWKVCNG